MNEEITLLWESIKEDIVEAEKDLLKNAKGNKAAGVRLRKQIKEISTKLKDLKKQSLQSRGLNE
jgi:hypothetical protein